MQLSHQKLGTHWLVVIALCVVLAVVVPSCGGSATAVTNTTSDNSASSNPSVTEVTACASISGHAQLICLADEFKKQLSSTQLAAVQRTYTLAEAKKWSNLPQSMVSSANKRVGLNFGAMTATQIQYAKALIKAAAGTATNEGWDEVQQIINADEYLLANGGGSAYGAANYYIALLGTPAATGTWSLQFGGHHLAFANTYANGELTGATPGFRSSEPFAAFSLGGVQNQPLVQERSALSAMLTALNAAEQASAKLGSTFTDILLGPQKDGQFPATPSGLKVGTLTQAQKDLVMAAIRTYTDDIADTQASAVLARYKTELDNTYISFSGTTDLLTQNDYVRIDGPSVWIEYSTQRGIVMSPTHPHTVWRDKTKDYGGNT